MIKEHYKKELILSTPVGINSGSSKKDVIRVQSWIVLHEMARPGSSSIIGIDGDFGSATELAVKNFQKKNHLRGSGVIGPKTFELLCEPLLNAFSYQTGSSNLRQTILAVANRHLESHPFEITIKQQNNSGPWVRSYMDGHEGSNWLWCMGFVQTIFDQAFSIHGRSFKEIMPLTYSCDTVGMHALNKGKLVRFGQVRSAPNRIKPGDIFLIQKSTYDWIHTGIITRVGTDTFETIEGNTNREGSSNGDRVYRRIRNFRMGRIDVYSWD